MDSCIPQNTEVFQVSEVSGISEDDVVSRVAEIRRQYESGLPRLAEGPLDSLVYRILSDSPGAPDWVARSLRPDLEVLHRARAEYKPVLTRVLSDIQSALVDRRPRGIETIVRAAREDREYAAIALQVLRAARSGQHETDDPLQARVLALSKAASRETLLDLDRAIQECIINE